VKFVELQQIIAICIMLQLLAPKFILRHLSYARELFTLPAYCHIPYHYTHAYSYFYHTYTYIYSYTLSFYCHVIIRPPILVTPGRVQIIISKYLDHLDNLFQFLLLKTSGPPELKFYWTALKYFILLF